MTIQEIKNLIESSEYDFLRTNENLAGKIGMLCLGGSLAYGTNLPGKGDVDIRGFAFEKEGEIIGLKGNFGQVVEKNTDTTIYSFSKLIELLLSCNPNTIEQLGCKKEHYLYLSPIAEELIANRDMFLSKRCIRSFGGYANQQLNRLENAIARDSLTQAKKEEHIRLSMENALAAFEDRYTKFDFGSIKLYTDESTRDDLDIEIFTDVTLKKYPARELASMLNEFSNILKVYGKLNHRNHKKDEEHLDKHAMHLLRLYYMVFDIMEKKEVITYRENERDFLLKVRQGEFRKEDGTYRDEFFELRKELNERFEYDIKHTELPDNPDMERVNDFVIKVNKLILRGEI